MVISHNLVAQNANRQFNITGKKKAKSTERLSSGYRINRSADDAAGLAISEKMRWQIRGLNRASKNIQDGISLVQIADGALGEVHSMVHRLKELATQASNDTNTDSDRKQLQEEVNQLKSEISRTFNTTEFNTMNIFRCPYTLGVSDDPNDIQVFNTDDSGSVASGSGGLIFNSKRYTWGELGASVTNGVFDSAFETDFTDPDNGERIDIAAKAGDSVSEVTRYYQLTADEEGVYVNNLPAARWAETEASGKWENIDTFNTEDGIYSFTFHGMEISFSPDEEDDRETMISRLNPDEFSSERTMYFTTRPAGTATESAVSSTAGAMVLDVTQINKNDIEDFAYEISADENGVTIKQTSGDDNIEHRMIAWSEFVNIQSGEPFKFTDWGLSDEGSNPQTFDADAVYRYSDTPTTDMETALSFTFTVRDEASRDSIIDGLNGITLRSGGVTSPLERGTTNRNGVTIDILSGVNYFTFQRDVLNRTFDDAVSPIEGTVTRSRTYIGETKSYVQTHTMTEAMVCRESEIYDDDDNLLGTDHTYESLTSQSADDSGTYTDDDGNTVKWKYTTGSSGFKYFMDNGNGNIVSADSIAGNGLYVRDASGTTIGNDDDHTGYTAASGSGQRYLMKDTGWSVDKVYKLYTNSYEYSNSDGDVVMTGTDNTTHIDSKNGVVNWKGEAVDTSGAYYSNPALTIKNSSGQTQAYKTAFGKDTTALMYTGGGYGTTPVIYMTFDNSTDSADGSGTANSMVGTKLIPNDEATRSFYKDSKSKGSSLRTDFESVTPPPPKKLLHIQSGAQPLQSIDIIWDGMSLSSIGLGSASVTTYDRAQRTMALADKANDIISTARSNFGAYQNRLEYAMRIDDYTAENTEAAESRIRDTDMSKESVEYAKQQILEQMGQSVLAQANQRANGVLQLLQ